MASSVIKCGPLIADLDGLELSDVDKDFLQHPRLGGLILFSRNYESGEQLAALVRCVREIRPQLLLCVDHEGGRVQRFRQGFSELPAMYHLSQAYRDDKEQALLYARAFAELMAAELGNFDIDFSFAPVLDIADLNSAVIGDRAFSDQPSELAPLASAFIDGMHAQGMKATAKHFPGHGAVLEDSHYEMPVDTRSFDEILERDLQPFIDLQPHYDALMTAHIQFPQVDEQPVSYSSHWIKSVLRKQLGFDGLVFSDDLSMKGAAGDGAHDFSLRAQKALGAGCDVVLICNQRREAERVLEQLEAQNLGESGKLDMMRRVPVRGAAASKAHYQANRDKLTRFTERYG
ncbi:beta-N-acetylhexosaminidase [Agaribacterium haliotis]|uniref:beta-N-acetylhexosaminidase n=1 Tax=Agaribacterium haliotis TaxID=2013869 RepID=UPI000BB58A24|nr:beta-N-acetylhexosaminidase [Agaribacterium haliotis]